VTRPAFLGPVKTNSLNFKILSNQFVQLHPAHEDISPNRAWTNSFNLERSTELIEDIEREKSDLSFVVLLLVKISVPTKTSTRYAFDSWNLDGWKLVRLAPVMPFKIMAGRDVKMKDFHHTNDIIGGESMKADGVGPGQIIRRRADGTLEYHRDELTIEEPLEIRVGDKTIATTMRTPGRDEELAAGFLLSEAIVQSKDQIERFSRPETARNRENIIVVHLAGETTLKLNSVQRFGTISSSCGLCGKESIDAIRQNFAPIQLNSFRIPIETLLSLPEALREHQSDFTRTGGIHAAGIFEAGGKSLVVREDIGRHNAVDKAIGHLLLEGKLPIDRHILLVSGRASFEIMQKALAAGIPIVASVSAPSSLAMEFARESNQTLVGFLRPPSFNIYSHVERVVLEL